MRLIGGLLVADGSRTPASAEVAAMPHRLGARHAAVRVEEGPLGLFTTIGEDGPTSTADVLVVADLEVTNLGELQMQAGAHLADGVLLAALYQKEGPRFVERLRGGFAVALWDRRRRSLLLAVDQFGIKRLHYAEAGGRLAFASRPAALLAVPGVDAGVDPGAIFLYLNFGFVPSPVSAFRAVRRLAPGHLLQVRDGRPAVERYWDVEYREQPIREGEAARSVYRLAEDAVAASLGETNAKEVGAFLSGGTDSSTIVGLATRRLGSPVNAFSIGFREADYNELNYAEVAARHFGAAHYTRLVGADDALAALPRLVERFDEPFGNNSAIGTLFCAEPARECGVSRLLAGDGGDEIFAGNARYRDDRIFGIYHDVPAPLRHLLLEPVLRRLPDGGASVIGRAQRYVRRANIPNPDRFYSWEFFVAQRAGELIHPELLATVGVDGPTAVVRRHYHAAMASAELNRLLYLDLKLAIGDNDLVKVTGTAELAGVDVRFPMLDVPLVEFTATLPARLKMRGFKMRHVFGKAFGALLPAATLAKRKQGFGVPTALWLRTHPRFRDLARDLLLSPRLRERGQLRAEGIARLLDLHDGETSAYYGDLLWRVLMLELWQRRHVDGERAA